MASLVRVVVIRRFEAIFEFGLYGEPPPSLRSDLRMKPALDYTFIGWKNPPGDLVSVSGQDVINYTDTL